MFAVFWRSVQGKCKSFSIGWLGMHTMSPSAHTCLLFFLIWGRWWDLDQIFSLFNSNESASATTAQHVGFTVTNSFHNSTSHTRIPPSQRSRRFNFPCHMSHFHPHVFAHHSSLSTAILPCLREVSCIVGRGAPPPCTVELVHLRAEISRVYLVSPSPCADLPIRTSACLQILTYSERNDGLQNYRFKFPPPSALISGRRLASPPPLTLRRIHFRKLPDSFPSVWWKPTRYETEQEADFFFLSR